MEGRATAAAFKDGKLTVWASTQNAQLSRLILTAIGLPPDAIRVVAPDVGGGFGAKIGVDREQIVVAWAAKHTGRPVRWVETRNENLMAMTQGRAQLHHIKIGGDRDGHIKAYRLDVVQDSGAYSRMGGFLPMLTNLMAPGVYDIPAVEADYKAVVTNGTPIAAYRGAGRPEAAATIERAVDWFAAEAGLDPAVVRRLNFIQKDQFPFVTKTGAPYDTGDYEAALDKVLDAADYDAAARASSSAAARPATPSCSASAWPPTWRSPPPTAAAGETAKVEVHDDGTATVYTGSSAHGQGHHTAFAMIVQDETRHPDGQDRGHPRRHRPGPGRRGHLRLPLAAARRLRRAQGGDRGQGGGGQEGGRALRGRRSRRRARRRHRHLAHRRRPGQVAVLVAGRRGTPTRG